MANLRQMILAHQERMDMEVVEKYKFLPNVDWHKATPEEIMFKLAEHVKNLSPDAAASALAPTGMSREMAIGMRSFNGAEGAIAAIGEALRTAITEKQVKAATDLAIAAEKLTTEFDSLNRKMLEFTSGALLGLMNSLTEFIKKTQEKPEEAAKNVGWVAGLFGLAKLFPKPGVAAIYDFLSGKPANAGEDEALRRNVPGAGAYSDSAERRPGSGPDNRSTWQKFKDWIRPPAATAPIPGAQSSVPIPQNVAEAISQAEGTWVNGKIDYNVPLGAGKYGRPEEWGRKVPLSEMTLAEVEQFGREVLRPAHGRDKGKAWEDTSSASGAFQITGSNIKRLSEKWGLDMNTVKFDQDMQAKMAMAIWAEQGSTAWEGFKNHEHLRAKAQDFMIKHGSMLADKPAAENEWLNKNAPFPTLARPKGLPMQFTDKPASSEPYYGPGSPFGMNPPSGPSSTSRSAFPPGTKFNSRGEAYSDTPAADVSKVNASMAAIKAAQQAGKPWFRSDKDIQASIANRNSSMTTSNDNSSTFNNQVGVNSINVYTQGNSTDGLAIGGGVSNAIKRQLLTANVNTGLY
jgi:hypothetical protein